MKKIEVVAAIIKNNGSVLCCQRESNKLSYLSEKWEFPGGKLEYDETLEQALIREIYEELEMKIYDLQFALTVIHKYPDFELTMHSFFASTVNLNYKLLAHKKVIWSSIEDLSALDWAAADIPIIEYLKNKT